MAKKSSNKQKERLFEEKLVPGKPGSGELFDVSYGDESKPVECLGMTFPNDKARRAHFTEILRQMLKDPTFRKIDGFPIGEDEDILALSNPPLYTACPNPFLADFIRLNGQEYNASQDDYSREPFAADVSEGKNDPIYNAHSYHTKVPHKAIMRYILHYTQPGDIVYDGFCGTGMTAVASQLCGDKAAVESLGYIVKPNGNIVDSEGVEFSKLGTRTSIIGDLSPAASFIAHNYNAPISASDFKSNSEQVIAQLYAKCSWMYFTLDRPTPAHLTSAVALLKKHKTQLWSHDHNLPKGRINYTIWSDVFLCFECSQEVVFWDAALDKDAGEVRDEFPCPHCGAQLTKRNVERAFVTVRDAVLNQNVKKAKQVPVLIKYTAGKERLEKVPDAFDRELLNIIEAEKPSDWMPSDLFMGKGGDWGNLWRPGVHAGITHTHHFYTTRNLFCLAQLFQLIKERTGLNSRLAFAFTAMQRNVSRLAGIAFSYYFHGGGGAINAGTKGTLYMSSTAPEVNVLDNFEGRLGAVGFDVSRGNSCVLVQSASASDTTLPDSSADYVFTDPPFGGNLMYSELNYLWEAWLRVKTNSGPEAIENDAQNKGLPEYQRLMSKCFSEYYRVLKPGRWMTVEFHNSQNKVWTAIQEGIQHAGFVVSDVRTLDKKQGSFKQYNSANAVKQDLVISAYKPTVQFNEQFSIVAGTENGAWEFVRSHLKHIPVFVVKAGRGEVIAERQGYLLFDRMVAFHVQRGFSVPLSAAEFYSGLRQKFPERDGMYFLSEQVTEYDRQRVAIKEVEQLQLFVNDEKSAIQWVRRQLADGALTYQQLSPIYMKEAQRVWEKHEQPLELATILEQSFVKDHDNTWRIPDPQREADLEQLRHRALMKEFQQYLDSKGKLKVVRTEALRAGFKDSWQKKDYATIVQMAKRVPDAVIQEDPALLMYFDNASLLKGE